MTIDTIPMTFWRWRTTYQTQTRLLFHLASYEHWSTILTLGMYSPPPIMARSWSISPRTDWTMRHSSSWLNWWELKWMTTKSYIILLTRLICSLRLDPDRWNWPVKPCFLATKLISPRIAQCYTWHCETDPIPRSWWMARMWCQPWMRFYSIWRNSVRRWSVERGKDSPGKPLLMWSTLVSVARIW